MAVMMVVAKADLTALLTVVDSVGSSVKLVVVDSAPMKVGHWDVYWAVMRDE